MRVTHISIIHAPLDVRIFEKQCRTLAAAGHDVHLVVAGAPAEEIDGVRLHSVAGDGDRPPCEAPVGAAGEGRALGAQAAPVGLSPA